MIWFLLQKIGFFVFLFFTIYFVCRRKYESLLTLYFWGLTFATCYYYAFTIWFPVKVVALGMILCLFFKRNKRSSPSFKIILPFVLSFVLIVFFSDLVGLLSPGIYATHINRYIRMFNSNYTYITTILLLFYGLILRRGFVKHLFPSYCLAVEIAIAFGLIHFICLKLGIGFIPILRQDGSVNLEALAEMGGRIVPRIYGVSGEPKSLGFLICPYLFASLVMYRSGVYRINRLYHQITLLLGTFVLINTYSSSALINFFLAFPLILILLPFPRISYKTATIIVLFVIASCLWILKSETNIYQHGITNGDSYVTQLYDRTFGRAQTEMENDRQESVILEHFVTENSLVHILFGWGVSQYTFHVPGQTVGNSLIPVQSGLVLTIADFGLMGLLLLLFMGFVILKLLRLSRQANNIYALAFSAATLSAFIGSLMFGSIVTCLIYMMMALYAYYDERELVLKKNR